MKNKLYKVIYTVLIAALILVVLLLLATKLPIPGNWHVYIVQSGSMEPTIKTGSIVIVKPEASYHAGDIITFSSRGNSVPITHRIVEAEQSGAGSQFITRGDANDAADLQSVANRQVLGKVVLAIPYLGYGIAAAKQPFGFLAIIIIPALLIIWEEAGKIRKELAGRRNKTGTNID